MGGGKDNTDEERTTNASAPSAKVLFLVEIRATKFYVAFGMKI